MALACVASAQTAHAQAFGALLESGIPFDVRDPERPTVVERPRRELAPIGIAVRPFVVFPAVATGTGFSNNVFGARAERESDFYLQVSPSLDAQSRWSRHMLQVRARGDLRRHLHHPIREQSRYDVAVEGRLDFAGASNLYARARVDRTYLEQYAGSFPGNAAGPVPLARQSAVVRATYRAEAVRLIGQADVQRLDFSDARTRAGDVLDQDFRDKTVTGLSLRAEYGVAPARALFVQGSYARHDQDSSGRALLDRNGDESRILAGVAFYPTPLIRARIAAGYLSRRYDDPSVSDLDGLAIDVHAEYLLTRQTTISLAATRTVEDAILSSSPGYIVTRVEGRVDHEVRRNLLVHAEAGFEHDDYVDVSRRDSLLRLAVGASYTPQRRLVVEPSAQFISRESDGEPRGLRFDEARLVVTTTFRM